MADEALSIQRCFADAESDRVQLEELFNIGTEAAQTRLTSALDGYKTCRKIRDDISLFSPNEELEDVSSGDLRQEHRADFKASKLTRRQIHACGFLDRRPDTAPK